MVSPRRACVVRARMSLDEGLNGGNGALVEEFDAEEIVSDCGSVDDSEAGGDAVEGWV